MMLISPLRILKSCGSSSRLSFRSVFPHFNKYCSGFSSWCVGTSCGVDIFIERNFKSMKYFLFFPMRFCLNSAGPGSSCLMAAAIISIGIPSTMIPIKDSTMSIRRLKKCVYMIAIHSLNLTNYLPVCRRFYDALSFLLYVGTISATISFMLSASVL